MDGLAARGAQAAEQAAVEPLFEAQDGQFGGTGGGVLHGGEDFFLGEGDVCAASFLLATVHEGRFVR